MTHFSDQRPPIIFDFGGVLIDWDPRYLYRKLFDGDAAMESFFTEINFSDWNLRQDEGRPFTTAVAELSARFPHYAALIAAYDQRWEESVSGPIQPTVDLLYTLRQAAYPLYGLTNWSAEKFEITRSKYTFFDIFEFILVSGEVKLIKPDPRIFQLLLDRIGRPAEECVFIDDSAVNAAAATRLGFKTIRYESSEQLTRELSTLGLLPASQR